MESWPVLQSQTSKVLPSPPRFKNNRVELGPKKGGVYQPSVLAESRPGEGKALPSVIDQSPNVPSSQAATRSLPSGENSRRFTFPRYSPKTLGCERAAISQTSMR